MDEDSQEDNNDLQFLNTITGTSGNAALSSGAQAIGYTTYVALP